MPKGLCLSVYLFGVKGLQVHSASMLYKNTYPCTIVLIHIWKEGRGGGGQREDRGVTVHNKGRKYQHD
jgi:hypothetical protein